MTRWTNTEAEQILVVEDDLIHLKRLEKALEYRGLNTRIARNVDEARAEIAKLADRLAIAILDIRLNEERTDGPDGTDLAQEILTTRVRAPDIVFHTQMTDARYYRAALALRAEAYLEKGRDPADKVSCVVLAVLLRRRLAEASEVASLEHLVRGCAGRSKAVERYCTQLLLPVLARTLVNRTAVLFRDDRGTSLLELDQEHNGPMAAWETLQALAEGAGSWDAPFLYSHDTYLAALSEPGMLPVQADLDTLRRFDGAAFVPLVDDGARRITLVVLPGVSGLQPDGRELLVDEPEVLASALLRHLRREVIQRSIEVAVRWAEAQGREQAIYDYTSRFLLFASQVQREVLDGVEEDGRLSVASTKSLETLSAQLEDAGQILAGPMREVDSPTTPEVLPSVAELLKTTADEIDTQTSDPALHVQVRGDASVHADWEDLRHVGNLLIRWFRQRSSGDPSQTHGVEISISETRGDVAIAFEGDGPVLPRWVRDRLFEPFDAFSIDKDATGSGQVQLGLYLAQLVVRARMGGRLMDETPEFDAQRHRFVVHLSQPTRPEAGGAHVSAVG